MTRRRGDTEKFAEVLVRGSILRRIPNERLARFIIEHVKPKMIGGEVLDLRIRTTVDVSSY